MNGAESLIRTRWSPEELKLFHEPGTSECISSRTRPSDRDALRARSLRRCSNRRRGRICSMTGKPACTLLHLGPGFANGLANLHNANRAQVPIVNIIGQHATYHLRHDTPLTADIEAFARPYSKWLRTSCSAPEISTTRPKRSLLRVLHRAGLATDRPCCVAWSEGAPSSAIHTLPKAPIPAPETIERAAILLRSGLQPPFCWRERALRKED